MTERYHIPVLLTESIKGLAVNPDGVYVDATYGGGGHSAKILEQLTGGYLIAFDQDCDVSPHLPVHDHFIFVHHNFRFLKNFLQYYQFRQIDGIIADLGVSSHDFDTAERGFSFRMDGVLDMRMNQSGSLTAQEVLNQYEEQDLIRIFRDYGELSNARSTAAVLVEARQKCPIETTGSLCALLEPLVPRKAASKYLAKVFQAVRIEVNREMDALKTLLTDAAAVLKPGGRLVVISYHSLEDR
nr:16S rRNA (cytosine(1402)-N(4))-methyltransferase RsmH [Prolixibacteraceae bacterium]